MYMTRSEVHLLMERQKVDCRRIEDAFFQYAVLITQAKYSEQFELSELPMHHDTSNTLITFTAKFHEDFMKRHSGMCF